MRSSFATLPLGALALSHVTLATHLLLCQTKTILVSTETRLANPNRPVKERVACRRGAGTHVLLGIFTQHPRGLMVGEELPQRT
ncbi:hypothetical protein ACFSUS_28370 [Spirosoma soli]|uniref:Secreted protein n=1 Tax=Spirosoma soli TaxID=1770529 RepID=A0ABW5MBZ3_9BACT